LAWVDTNMGDLVQREGRERSQNSGGIGVVSWAENQQYHWNGAR